MPVGRFSWFASSQIPQEYDVPVTDVDLMADDDDFEWKGQESLGIRACQFQHPRGFQPQHILQVASKWKLYDNNITISLTPSSKDFL